jgi:hypothetical protein
VRVRSGRVAQLVAQLDHRDALLRLRLRKSDIKRVSLQLFLVSTKKILQRKK